MKNACKVQAEAHALQTLRAAGRARVQAASVRAPHLSLPKVDAYARLWDCFSVTGVKAVHVVDVGSERLETYDELHGDRAGEGEAEPLTRRRFTTKDLKHTERWHIGLRSLNFAFASQQLCGQRVPCLGCC